MAVEPRQLVLPDVEATHVWLVSPFKHFLERHEIRAIERLVVERDSAVLDSLVVVNVLLQIEIDLPVLWVSVMNWPLTARMISSITDRTVISRNKASRSGRLAGSRHRSSRSSFGVGPI